jgi:crotonobetainyl-CoA:carnitine CoA-transferase CaiB-like acyl-CoA transferase
MEGAIMTEITGPLAGLRIVDLSTIVSGPLATAVLADQGADVIKIEAPKLGDMSRYQGSKRGGLSGMFHIYNRAKRSIVLDLKAAEGRDALLRILKGADALLHNFRPGVMERLGLGYETVAAMNPLLVYASISGYGERGPMASRPAYDNMIQAFAGYVSVQGADPQSGDYEPAFVRNILIDKLTAHHAAQAITAALLARFRGAGGQQVKLSMLHVALSFLWGDAAMGQQLLAADAEINTAPMAYSRLYRFKNGHATFNASDASFVPLCKALGAAAGEDPRLHTRIGRFAHQDLMADAMAQWAQAVARMDIDEGIALLESLDVPCAKVMSLDDLPDHPQVVANAIFRVSDHPVIGPVREPNHPIAFSTTPARTEGLGPLLGEHTDVILQEAGFTPQEIAGLRERGVAG